MFYLMLTMELTYANVMTMSIKIRFETGSMVVAASLKDEALTELLSLVSKHQAEDASPPPIIQSVISRPAQSGPTGLGGTKEIATDWLSRHSAAEALNVIGWERNTDKILLLGAYHENYTNADDGWKKGDLESRFAEAKEAIPGNLSRDISLAVKDGVLAPVTPRTYAVSRTGWNRIAEAIKQIEGV
jgi:hypothetical protein